MSLAVTAEARRLSRQLRSLGKPGGDPWLQHYVGSPVPVLGLSVPRMRGILAAFRKEHRDITAKELNALAAAIRKGPSFEEKSLAVYSSPRILGSRTRGRGGSSTDGSTSPWAGGCAMGSRTARSRGSCTTIPPSSAS